MDTGRGKLVAVAVTSVSCNSQSKVQRLKRKPQTDRQQSVLEQETAGVIILCSPRQLSSIINRQRMNEIVKCFDVDSSWWTLIQRLPEMLYFTMIISSSSECHMSQLLPVPAILFNLDPRLTLQEGGKWCQQSEAKLYSFHNKFFPF